MRSSTNTWTGQILHCSRRGLGGHTPHLPIDDSREAKVIEDLSAVAPHVDRAILALAFVIETIDLGDLPALVVPSDQVDAIRIAHLHTQHHTVSLNSSSVLYAVDESLCGRNVPQSALLIESATLKINDLLSTMYM